MNAALPVQRALHYLSQFRKNVLRASRIVSFVNSLQQQQFRNDCHRYRGGFRAEEPVTIVRRRIAGDDITNLLKYGTSNNERTEHPATLNRVKEFLSKPGRQGCTRV